MNNNHIFNNIICIIIYVITILGPRELDYKSACKYSLVQTVSSRSKEAWLTYNLVPRFLALSLFSYVIAKILNTLFYVESVGSGCPNLPSQRLMFKRSTNSRSNWNLEMLVFWGGRKTGVPGEKPSEQGRELTTNSTHIWRRVRESNPGHIGGRRALSPLRHPCSP